MSLCVIKSRTEGARWFLILLILNVLLCGTLIWNTGDVFTGIKLRCYPEIHECKCDPYLSLPEVENTLGKIKKRLSALKIQGYHLISVNQSTCSGDFLALIPGHGSPVQSGAYASPLLQCLSPW